MIVKPTLKERALEALAAKRDAETETFPEMLEQVENEVRGVLQGLLLRALDVRPCMSFARVLHNVSDPVHPDCVIEVDGVLLCAHWTQYAPQALGPGRDDYALFLARKCDGCGDLMHVRCVTSLADLGQALESNEGGGSCLCWGCNPDPFAE